MSDNCASGTINFSEISGNTSNTLTYQGAGYAANMSFCAGDSLEIRKVVQVLDGSGRAGGSSITGNPPARPANSDAP